MYYRARRYYLRRTMKNTAATARAVTVAAAADAQHRQQEHAFRYDTDPTYRGWVDQQHAGAREVVERKATRRRQLVGVPLFAVCLLVVAVAVWMPQLAVTRVRRTTFRPWNADRLRTAWAALMPGNDKNRPASAQG